MANEIVVPKADLTESDVLAKLNELDDEPEKKIESKSNKEEDELDIPDIKEKEDKPEKKVAKSKEDESKEDESEEDETEDEEELEEELNLDEEEDELKLLIPAKRKDILKEFPTLFKKFPGLERAMYREQGYTEVYPTIKEAKESVELLRNYKDLESSILEGNIEGLLKNVKESNPESLNRIADDYLQALYKVDQSAYNHVLNNVFKYTVKSMVQIGKQNNNDQLVAAAELFHQFYFGNADFKEPTKLAKVKDDKVDEVEKERSAYLEERFNDARDELGTRIDNKLKSVISQAIDMRGEMTDYVKDKAVEDCIRQLHNQIGADSRTAIILKNLWIKARETKFDKTSVSKIGSAYLSVAKSLLQPIIRENRTKALSGAKRLVKVDSDKNEKFKGSNDEKGERTRPGKMKPNETVEEFLMRD